MTPCQLDNLVNAVLYKGYLLYPHRPAATKVFPGSAVTFGRVYPEEYSQAQSGAEPSLNQTECLLHSAGAHAEIRITVRFLQPVCREAGHIDKRSNSPIFQTAVSTSHSEQSFREATERENSIKVNVADLLKRGPVVASFSFRGSRELEALPDGSTIQRRQDSLQGTLTVAAVPMSESVFKITICITNQTPVTPEQCDDPNVVLMRTFASTHTILRVSGGEFVSLLDPPDHAKGMAEQCRNIGTWPTLVGDEALGERDTILSSPIILYDYPHVAPAGRHPELNSAEIDEMLALRVMTMTDAGKLEMAEVGEDARQTHARAQASEAAELLRRRAAHPDGPTRDFLNLSRSIDILAVNGRELRVGDSVRIRPRKRATFADPVPDEKTVTVEAIEEDAEGHIHLALITTNASGKNAGATPDHVHRIFCRLDEVELMEAAPQ